MKIPSQPSLASSATPHALEAQTGERAPTAAPGRVTRTLKALAQRPKTTLAGLGILATLIAVPAARVARQHASSGADVPAGPAPLPWANRSDLPQVPGLFVQDNLLMQAATSAGAAATRFMGRGVNLNDVRDCAYNTVGISQQTLRDRIDMALSVPGLNMLRLVLETEATNGNIITNATYRQSVKDAVDYVGRRGGAYVEVSIWNDPSLTPLGWPTNQTNAELRALVDLFGNSSHVLFGVSNEPQLNANGVNDSKVLSAMNSAVAAIRQRESETGALSHTVLVQGTRLWAADVSYYLNNPVTAGGGKNVAYEIHAYFNQDYFQSRIFTPATSLPLIIGEFGPTGDAAGNTEPSAQHLNDSIALMHQANANNISHMAWNFNALCPPSLLVSAATHEPADNSSNQALVIGGDWGNAWQGNLLRTA